HPACPPHAGPRRVQTPHNWEPVPGPASLPPRPRPVRSLILSYLATSAGSRASRVYDSVIGVYVKFFVTYNLYPYLLSHPANCSSFFSPARTEQAFYSRQGVNLPVGRDKSVC